METAAIKVEVNATAMTQLAPSLGLLNSVIITQTRQVEEFHVDKSDGGRIISSGLGSYPDSSVDDQQIFLRFQNLTRHNVHQRIHSLFHDHDLSRLITDRIVTASQLRGLPQQRPLFIPVFVKFTKKEYVVVAPPSSTVKVDRDSTCVICLETMSESEQETKPLCELPNCVHMFHEDCVIEWLAQHDSCPLCRRSVKPE
ncbi:unnamed protein product [Microthlaspi erraticum]|uniref:RING-type E3 ubiquitin transferase n=1 Tax=Microthlaspi erraticum TaxID=1685480 RepID=A0A6D2IWV5_9BRAS|nr:unnamed protein product [Microthlaspi erraticum]